MATGGLFPCPSKASMQDAFVGMHLNDVPTPAAVLDRAILRRNCAQMLEACEELGVKFRAHVKTHSTYISRPQCSYLITAAPLHNHFPGVQVALRLLHVRRSSRLLRVRQLNADTEILTEVIMHSSFFKPSPPTPWASLAAFESSVCEQIHRAMLPQPGLAFRHHPYVLL